MQGVRPLQSGVTKERYPRHRRCCPIITSMEGHMSATGLEVFDKTIQVTNIWLGEIMERLGPDRHVAWHVLGAVLRTVRDRLPLGLSAHLAAQLPLLVRGTYFDQWRPTDEPQKWRSQEEFLEAVSEGLRNIRPVAPAEAARSVFMVLNHHVDP